MHRGIKSGADRIGRDGASILSLRDRYSVPTTNTIRVRRYSSHPLHNPPFNRSTRFARYYIASRRARYTSPRFNPPYILQCLGASYRQLFSRARTGGLGPLFRDLSPHVTLYSLHSHSGERRSLRDNKPPPPLPVDPAISRRGRITLVSLSLSLFLIKSYRRPYICPRGKVCFQSWSDKSLRVSRARSLTQAWWTWVVELPTATIASGGGFSLRVCAYVRFRHDRVTRICRHAPRTIVA